MNDEQRMVLAARLRRGEQLMGQIRQITTMIECIERGRRWGIVLVNANGFDNPVAFNPSFTSRDAVLADLRRDLGVLQQEYEEL